MVLTAAPSRGLAWVCVDSINCCPRRGSACLWTSPFSRPPDPVRHKIGVFITDLHGFDLSRGTFGANFWIWAVGPNSARALQTMEFPNADTIAVRLESTMPRGDVSWSQRKLTGTFHHQWDLGNYPFDRHALAIILEEGIDEEPAVSYEADAANSGFGLEEAVEGWRIRSMRIEVESATYATNFGDPAISGPASRFGRLRAMLELERSDWTGFAKLTAALYAGFLICLIGCLVPVNATTFAPRVTLLVASLFAMVINMRSASAALGSEHGLTLIDKLHVAGLAYVVAIAQRRCWSGYASSTPIGEKAIATNWHGSITGLVLSPL